MSFYSDPEFHDPEASADLLNQKVDPVPFDPVPFHDDVIAIPKTNHPERQAENRAAAEVTLDRKQLAELDRLFPPPNASGPLPIV